MSTPLLSRERLEELLDKLGSVRVGVVGDACIDVYWDADMTRSRLARENPHYIMPVVEERISPGGGSNAAACVAALGVKDVPLLGVIGDDWRGRELSRVLPDYGVSPNYLVQSPERITTAYCKPVRRGICEVVYEDPHLYFENHVPLSEADEKAVLAKFDELIFQVDALIVADYLQFGVVTDTLRSVICRAGAAGMPILVDSRDRIHCYHNVILKPNELEALQAIGSPISAREATVEQLRGAAVELALNQCSRVCMTLGERGAVWVEIGQAELVPTSPAPPPIDIVGAGDCFAAAFTTALAAGASGPEAAAIANLAAKVTVRKIGATGTATAAEILQQYTQESYR